MSEEQSATCAKCGTQMSGQFTECPLCHSPLRAEGTPAPPARPAAVPPQKQPRKRKRKGLGVTTLFKKKSKCPYCQRVLDQKPKRKKKCPHCGNPIYIRKGELRTELDALASDWLGGLEHLGITRKVFDQHYRQLQKQYGFPPSLNDAKWRVLNSMISPGRGPRDLAWVYREMAGIVQEEGKDASMFLEQVSRYERERFQKEAREMLRDDILKYVHFHGANDSIVCPACKGLAGKTLPVKEALRKNVYLPSCTAEQGCRCHYSFTIHYRD